MTKVANSSEVLRYVLPAAEANGERLLTYKLAHLMDNMTPERIEKILKRSAKKV